MTINHKLMFYFRQIIQSKQKSITKKIIHQVIITKSQNIKNLFDKIPSHFDLFFS